MRAALRAHVHAPLLDCAGKVRVYDLQRSITIYRQFRCFPKYVITPPGMKLWQITRPLVHCSLLV